MPNQRGNLDAAAPSDTATIRIEENKKEASHKGVDEPVRLAVSPITSSAKAPPPPPNIPRTSLFSSSPMTSTQRPSLISQLTSLVTSSQRPSLISSQQSLIAPPSPRTAPSHTPLTTPASTIATAVPAAPSNTPITTAVATPISVPSSPPPPAVTTAASTPSAPPTATFTVITTATSPNNSAPLIVIMDEGSGSKDASIGNHTSFVLQSEGDCFEVNVFRPPTKSIMKKTAKLIEGPDGELEIVSEEPPSPVGPPLPIKHARFMEGDVTGFMEPEEDDHLDAKIDSMDRNKSVDFRGQDLELEGLDDDVSEDSEYKRQSYRERLRDKHTRKGRLPSQKAEKTDNVREMSPQEAAFSAETEQLVRNRDQLEVDVYALNQDIREKNKELERKKKQLAELLSVIRLRPYVWARVLDPNAPEPPSEKPESSVDPKRPRGSLGQPEDPQIVRIHVQKMGNIFSKDAKRLLELNQLVKVVSLHKLKREGRTEVIHAHQIHSCRAPDKNSPILNFKYYGDSDRKLLRSQKDLKLKFDTIFERERIFRVLREMLPKEKSAPSFTYVPQPLPISDKTQDRVNALPVFKLAGVLHDAWIERKENLGWRHGQLQDEVEKTHPQMKVFEKLTAEDQKFCMGMATLTLAGIFELGYSITKAQGNQKGFAPQLRSLTEFLAENAHESWADIKMKSGWKHDARADSSLKMHPDLIPYCDLDENAKEPDREAALTIISSLIKWGYCINRNSGDNFDTEPSV